MAHDLDLETARLMVQLDGARRCYVDLTGRSARVLCARSSGPVTARVERVTCRDCLARLAEMAQH